MTVNYPDNTIETVEGTKQGELYVATVRGCPTPGVSGTGYSVTADGTDESGVQRTGFVLGKGDVVVLDREGEIRPGERSFYMRLRDAVPDNPQKGDVVHGEDGARYFDGSAWVDFTEVVDAYTKEETDGLIEEVESKIPTATSQLENDSGFLTQHQSLSNYLQLTGGTLTGNLVAKNGIQVTGGELVVGSSSALRCNKKQIKSGYSPNERIYTLPDKSGTVAMTSDLSGFANASDVYTKAESDEKYLPLTGGTMTGDITFSGARHLVFGAMPRVEALFGGQYRNYYFPATSGVLALNSDVTTLYGTKADGEEETTYEHIDAGVFWSHINIAEEDIVVREEGGEFVDYSNIYTATPISGGFRITCTRARKQSHLTIRNETQGTQIAGTGSLDFDFGDEGEVFDGDEDWDSIYVLQNVDVETGKRMLTVQQSVEKRTAPLSIVAQIAPLDGSATQAQIIEKINAIINAFKSNGS